MSDVRIHAVVVTFFPDMSMLRKLVFALAAQANHVHIVDNTPAEDGRVEEFMASDVPANVSLRRLGANLGIAKALNVGIEGAIAVGATHVLLSDQDSFPAADMVERLLAVAQDIEAQGLRVGGVGAVFADRDGRMHKFQVPGQGRFFYATCAGDSATPWVEVIAIITSGSLIPVNALRIVGLMREDYFIDFVDIEWCFRARCHGFRFYGTSSARMEHHVGGNEFLAWYGNWRLFGGYHPDRLYYQYRNGVSLLSVGHVPLGWKLRMAWTWLGNIYAYVLFAPGRSRNLSAITRGIWDGMLGRGGPLKQRIG